MGCTRTQQAVEVPTEATKMFFFLRLLLAQKIHCLCGALLLRRKCQPIMRVCPLELFLNLVLSKVIGLFTGRSLSFWIQDIHERPC